MVDNPPVSLRPPAEDGVADHIRSLWRLRWPLLGVAALVAIVVFVWRASLDDVYVTEAEMQITVIADEQVVLDADQADFAARTVAEIAMSPEVVEASIAASGLSIDVDQATAALDVSASSPQGFIDVVVETNDASDAAALANGMVSALLDHVADSELGLGGRTIDAAGVPNDPTSPSPVRESIFAFLVVLIVAAQGVTVWRSLRGKLPLARTAEAVASLVRVPTVALRNDGKDAERLALFAATHLFGDDTIVVVQCDGPPSRDVSKRIGAAMQTVNAPAEYVDGDAAAGFATPSRSGHTIVGVSSAAEPGRAGRWLTSTSARTVLTINPNRTSRNDIVELCEMYGGPARVAGIVLVDRWRPETAWEPPQQISSTGAGAPADA